MRGGCWGCDPKQLAHDFLNMSRGEAIQLLEDRRRPVLDQAIGKANEPDTGVVAAFAGQEFKDGTAKAARHHVVFNGDQVSRGPGQIQNEILVKRLGPARVDYRDIQSLSS